MRGLDYRIFVVVSLVIIAGSIYVILTGESRFSPLAPYGLVAFGVAVLIYGISKRKRSR